MIDKIKKGRVMYVPPIVIEEIADIQREELIDTKSGAIKKLVEHSRCGREVQRIAQLDWSRKRPLKPVWAYKMKKRKTSII